MWWGYFYLLVDCQRVVRESGWRDGLFYLNLAPGKKEKNGGKEERREEGKKREGRRKEREKEKKKKGKKRENKNTLRLYIDTP